MYRESTKAKKEEEMSSTLRQRPEHDRFHCIERELVFRVAQSRSHIRQTNRLNGIRK